MRRSGIAALVVFAATLLVPCAALAQGTMQADGTVTDEQGTPLEGVKVTFSAESNAALKYEGKTNKKGKYFVPGMFTGKEGDRWKVQVEAANGLVPLEMHVESRTANRTLVGDPQTLKIKPNQSLPPVSIRPLGTATVNLKLATPERVVELRGVPAGDPAAAAQTQAKAQTQQMSAWDEALVKAQAMEYDAAIPLFEKAIEDKPEDAERERAFAQVLYKVERFDEAATHATRAIELEPDRVANLLVLYSAQVGKEDFTAARATLERARTLDPQSLEVLRQMAFLAERSGQRPDQIAAYEAIVAAAPDNVEGWTALGDLYAANNDAARSEAAYQKVVDLDPSNAHQVFFNLGALLMNKDGRSDADTRKAIAAFRKSSEMSPKYAPAWRELGFALINVGDQPEAKRALEQYLKLAPDAPDAARIQKVVGALKGAA